MILNCQSAKGAKIAKTGKTVTIHHSRGLMTSTTIDGEANPLATQAQSHLNARSVFTGCNAAMIRQWYAERRARRAAEAGVP